MRFRREPAVDGKRTTHRRWWIGIGAVLTVLVVLLGLAGSAGAQQSASSSSADATGLPGFRQGYVKVQGGSLHYVRGGSGPVLVLLHGWPQTWYEWHDVMPGLARTHTVVAFDLPGLGRSSVPSGGYDNMQTAARIHQGVSGLGYRTVSILAHDIGVQVGFAYARDFPGSVARLGVLEGLLNGFGLENYYGASWHFLFNQSPAPVPEELINDKTHVKVYFGWLFSTGADHPAKIAQSVYVDAYANAAHRSAGFDYFRAFPANAAQNQAHASTKLTIPLLAMGAQFEFGPLIAQSFRQVATDVHQVVAPDSGHWIPEENPAFLEQCATLFFGPPRTKPVPPALAGCTP